MPRDKFAAMASRAQMTNAAPTETGDGTSAAAPQQQPSETATAPPPKRDKLAALAARNTASQPPQATTSVPETTTASPLPKRDKMAALAARSPPATGVPATTMTATAPAADPATTASAPPPKRDKMAALAGRSLTPPPNAAAPSDARRNNNNKLEALASRQVPNEEETTQSREELAAKAALAREKHLATLQERLSKRKGILKRLDRAEELTCRLLTIAAKTTDALQDLNGPSSHLANLSVAYRSTLQELHPLLTDGTEELIKAYQNHTEETKQSMYAARVEMRLAKERKEVLQTFTDLEKAERESTSGGDADDRKRKRNDESYP